MQELVVRDNANFVRDHFEIVVSREIEPVVSLTLLAGPINVSSVKTFRERREIAIQQEFFTFSNRTVQKNRSSACMLSQEASLYSMLPVSD